MTVLISVADPSALLKSIKAHIDNKNVETWAYDSQGDFYHTPSQWAYQAWLRPLIEPGTLNFKLIQRKDTQLTKVVYGVYHGRFVEMLITHFQDVISAVQSTTKQPDYTL